MMRMLPALAVLGLLLGPILHAPSLQAAESVPGGLYLHPLGDGVVDVRYRDQPVLVHRQVAIVGIHLNARPGTHKLRLAYDDGTVALAFVYRCRQAVHGATPDHRESQDGQSAG